MTLLSTSNLHRERKVPTVRRISHGTSAFVLTWVFLLAVAVVAVGRLPFMRIGDGAEYYGLYLAWTKSLRPWMTNASFAAYAQFFNSGAVSGSMPPEWLTNIFSKLHVGDTADFNHFWFYSFLAAATNVLFRPFNLGIQASFLVLHALLFVILLAIVTGLHGWRGFVATLVLTIGSPLLWYSNKVHTEFLTFTMTLAGIALAMRRRMVYGALFMALAATQNPGLSFVPVVMLAIRALADFKKQYSIWEVSTIVATVGLLALHPFYYFTRYGAVTPQLVTTGANPGNALDIFYIWFIDPDVGLFPNWPLGIVVLLTGIATWRSAAKANTSRTFLEHPVGFWIVWTVFLLASVYSHASTENLNSGGTFGVSRYALWYVILVYPFLISAILYFSKAQKIICYIAAAILLLGTVAEMSGTLRAVDESYTVPSRFSKLLQTKFPGLYDPPPEIFRERYSGFGERPGLIAAVVGPDCSKILLLPNATNSPITVPYGCGFTGSQIQQWVTVQAASIAAPVYARLDPGNPNEVQPLPPLEIGQSYRPDEDQVLIRFDNWAISEGTHRWSNGDSSQIMFTIPKGLENLCLTLDGFTLGRQTIIVSSGNVPLLKTSIEGQGALTIPLPIAGGQTKLDLSFSNPHSPGPSDTRKLAFAIRSLTFHPCP